MEGALEGARGVQNPRGMTSELGVHTGPPILYMVQWILVFCGSYALQSRYRH